MSAAQLPVRQRDIDEQIESLIRKNYREAIVLMQSPTEWDGPANYSTADGATVAVSQANTPLALRWALTRLDTSVPWHFVVTPLGDADLVSDMRDRLTPYRAVQMVNATRSLFVAFSATTVLPGTISQADIPDTLEFLDSLGARIVPAPTGVVTPDHLAAQLLSAGTGLPTLGADGARSPSLAEVLEWSVSPEAAERWQKMVSALPGDVRVAAMDWLGRTLGPKAGAAVRYLRANGPSDMLAWGLAAEVLVVDPTARAEDAPVRQEATAVFRSQTRIGTSTAEEREGWATAAVAAVEQATANDHPLDNVIRQAEQLVTSTDALGAGQLLHLSSVCPGGFAARIERVAEALEATIPGGDGSASRTAQSATPAVSAYTAIKLARAHRDGGAAEHNREIASAEAALRLWQWLNVSGTTEVAATTSQPSTVTDWLQEQRDSLSWVNVCINATWREQSSTALHRVTRRVAEQARSVIQQRDRSFAAVASRTGASRNLAGSTLLVEDVLDRVLKPLLIDQGEVQPILLLVLDGMATASANQLLRSIDKSFHSRWHELATEDEELATALAMYPTVTTKSRTSLLSGCAATGGQSDETKGLSTWYRAATKGARGAGEARLMHKKELDSEVADIAGTVENTDANPLVAAVLNTIDDALDKSDPIDRQWSVADITHLNVLMQAAARAGRTVVLVSDHGHIVDRGRSTPSPLGGNSARWRPADPAAPGADDSEVVVAGDRVLTDDNQAILAVDEDLRYTARKAGYHGGLSLAEASIPVSILSQDPEQLQARMSGSLPLVQMVDSMRHPTWWELREDFVEISRVSTPDTEVAQEEPDGLFSIDIAPAPTRPVLFHGLETNPGFKAQVAEVPIAGQDAASIANLLRTIGTNNNTLPRVQLQKAMNLSNIQFNGALTKLKRILNIDGVEVLNNSGGDITLNAEQLIQQFGLRRGR